MSKKGPFAGLWAGLALLLLAIPALAVFPAAAAQEAPTAVLTEIRSITLTGEVDFEIRVTGKFHYTLTEMTSPARLVLDLEPVLRRWAVNEIKVGAYGVSTVRVSQSSSRVTRIVFDLTEAKPLYRIGQNPDGIRVVFSQPEAVPAVRPPAAAPKPEAKPPATAAGPPAPRRSIPSTMLGGGIVTYHLTDERFTEIFGSQTGWSAGLELSQLFLPGGQVRPGLGFDYMRLTKSGLSSLSQTPTTLGLDVITLSGFLVYGVRPVSPYLGVGAAFTRYRESSALHNTDGRTTGLSLQAGMLVHLGKLDWLKLKVFGKWTKASVLVNEIQADLGGLAFGLSVLAAFSAL
jgi:hypothetical protein